MRDKLLQMEYFETYYYANIVHTILNNRIDFGRNLNNWHEDSEVELFLQPFSKFSVLHEFAYFVITSVMYENMDNIALDQIVKNPMSQLWVDNALHHHGIHTQGFCGWLQEKSISLDKIMDKHVQHYYEDLDSTGQIHELITHLSNEVFYILFANRLLLANLNEYISWIVQDMEKDYLDPEHVSLLQKDGVLARVNIPKWVRRAVFFRDRGMCAACNRDLSGLVTVESPKHFDHIIPLAQGGINDVTNIQLLCEKCNLTKGRKPITTSNRYEAWYT